MPNKIRFSRIGPHQHSWIAECAFDGEELIKAIKRRRFCPECGESFAGRTVCECGTELVDVWPYRTPPDLWYDAERTNGVVWLHGSEPRGTFEVITEG